MSKIQLTKEQIDPLEADASCDFEELSDPRVEAFVNELIGHVADKWTMIILEVLTECGELRFTRLSKYVLGIRYKMLTQSLRVTVHPVVPPKVEYKWTELGLSLSAAFCGVWIWTERHLEQAGQARVAFNQRF